jgi:hypothetical protein
VQPSAPQSPVRPVEDGAGAARSPLPGQDTFDRLDLDSIMQRAYAQFTVQPATGRVSVKIIDSTTNEVIREIPPDVLLHFAEQVEAYLAARQRSAL